MRYKRNTTKYVKHLVLVQAIFKQLATRWKVFTQSRCDDVITKSSDRIFTEFKAEFWGTVCLPYMEAADNTNLLFSLLRRGGAILDSILTFTLWRVHIWTFLFIKSIAL